MLMVWTITFSIVKSQREYLLKVKLIQSIIALHDTSAVVVIYTFLKCPITTLNLTYFLHTKWPSNMSPRKCRCF